MPQNIESIVLGECTYNGVLPVTIKFKFPCKWTVLNIEDLELILKLWIIGEEIRYPQSKGYKGRALLKERIDKIFNETEVR